MEACNMNKKIKICFIASSGGHFEQLMMLKPIMEKYDSFVVSEKTKYNVEINYKKYNLLQVNRKEFFWFGKLFINSLKCLLIYVREKPNIIISTGALSTIPMCLLGKLLHAKLIYIESFAKTSSPTLTGKLLYKFADQFYVQWKQMLEIYPKAIYKGGIY